jgi:hypothetical protein
VDEDASGMSRKYVQKRGNDLAVKAVERVTVNLMNTTPRLPETREKVYDYITSEKYLSCRLHANDFFYT